MEGEPSPVNPDIVFKYTDADQVSYKDKDGANWRANNYNHSEFCSLGDVVTGHHDEPDIAVSVSKSKSDALVHPSKFTLVWNDAGSLAYPDAAFYIKRQKEDKLNAPPGGVNSHSTNPDTSKYYCVSLTKSLAQKFHVTFMVYMVLQPNKTFLHKP